nr:unnamed protein product [Trichobilharzia regenti]
MLQLYIALEPNKRLSLQEKSEIYLELYGNIMVRDISSKYLTHVADKLIRMTTNLDGHLSLTFIDVFHLKFKERDMLESVLKFWRGREGTKFDASKCWDFRLRKHLGTRYDAIPNVFDWDCSITLHDRKATQINSREYAHWRHHGNAFELRETNYNTINRSLASGRVFKNSAGDKGVYWGYWGDIICSPYLSFGIDTSEYPELSRRVNGKHAYSATTISEVNIRKIFWQLLNQQQCPISIAAPFLETSTTEDDGQVPGEKYECQQDNSLANNNEFISTQTTDKLINGDAKSKESEEGELTITGAEKSSQTYSNSFEAKFEDIEYIPLDVANTFKMKFLPLNSFLDLPTRYRSLFLKDDDSPSSEINRFRIVYIGNSLVHLLSDLHSREMKRKNLNAKSQDTETSKENLQTIKDETEVRKENGLGSDLLGTEFSFTDLLEDEALLIVESVLYIVEIRAEQVKAYCEHVKQMAYDLDFEVSKEINPLEDHHLYFRFKRKSSSSSL